MDGPVRTVVVGLNFGASVIRDITAGGGKGWVRLIGVCDLDSERSRVQAASLGVRTYASLDDVVADEAVEAVGLFTGPAGRADLIRKIVRGGKHVMTTKPFEIDAAAALSVLREANSLRRVVALNSPSLVLPPDLTQLAAWREQFDLGRPVGGRFEVTASYQESADGRWYDDPNLCPVAPIFRIGIYQINDAVRIFGEAEDVAVLSSRVRTGRPTPDNAQLGIRFRSGALANIYATFCVRDGDAHRNQMTVSFERGTVYRNAGPQQSAYREGASEMALVRSGDSGREVSATAVLERYHPQFAYQWDIFSEMVRGTVSYKTVKPETVAAGIRIIEAMKRADADGHYAAVEPVE